MASPTIPHLSLNVPKKRPALSQTPSASSTTSSPTSAKRRKSSIAGPSSLRQTSFPNGDKNVAAPQTPGGASSRGGSLLRSPSVESSVVNASSSVRGRTTTPSVVSGVAGSALSATTGRVKRKYTRRSTAGKDGAASAKNRSGSGSARGGTAGDGDGDGSLANGANAGGEDEEGENDNEDEDMEEAAGQATLEGGKMSEAAQKQEREHMAMLLEAFTPEQADRYDMWRRVKLRKDSVRRLVNHTLSQSVPASVVTTVSGYTKVMIGELVERARDVQLEWQAAASRLPTGEAIADDVSIPDRTKRIDRGPLTPDHLREALRRYKKEHPGGGAGYTGLSLKGKEIAAARTGGRKLFR